MSNPYSESDARIALENLGPKVRSLLDWLDQREADLAAVTSLMICRAEEFTVDPEEWPESYPVAEPGQWLWLDTKSGAPTWRVVDSADEAIDAVFAAAGRLPESERERERSHS